VVDCKLDAHLRAPADVACPAFQPAGIHVPNHRSEPSAYQPTNRLLRSLPLTDFERLRPELRTIPAPVHHLFYKAGATIDFAYFPNAGVVSITTLLGDGRMVEAATVGYEGMVGVEALLSSSAKAQGQTMMQVADEGATASMLPVRELRALMKRNDDFADRLGRYTVAVLRQSMHSTACNALHHVRERCARWLLQTHDRVGADSFQLSHEYLGTMLGVRRQSVTVVAGALQRAGLITYRQAIVQIRDREGLEAASCECYGLIRRDFDALSV
jgi:CRP-like cAMP-binding protein